MSNLINKRLRYIVSVDFNFRDSIVLEEQEELKVKVL